MKLHEIDILIICAYLIAMIVIGLILKKRAAQNMDSYFLGGKSLPFYMLGLSNASGMYNPQIQISAESETKRSIFREKDKTKRSKKESAQHSKSRNKSFVMTSVSAL